jgi:DNA repair exonuclease SbcCD ATPase subunit
MKIVKLEAENVKRLRAVTIEPDGSVVVVRGNNGQGKSSVLDSIAYALGGKSLQPAKVIRDGEKEAIVRVELDGLTIERKWTSNDRSVLEVRAADGSKVSSPQTMLDSLVGRLSFDPLAYLSMPPAKQLEALQKVVGLDFRELDEQRKRAYDERTEVNRKVNHTKIQLEPLRDFSDTEPVSLAELSDQVAALSSRRADEQAAAKKLKALVDDRRAAAHRVKAQETRLENLRRQLEQESAHLQELMLEAERLERTDTSHLQAVADHELETIAELETVKAKIKDAELINERARKVAERRRLEKVLTDHEGESYALTKQIEKIDAIKLSKIEAARFPVDGLSFGDAGVLYNGQPFEQASQAEKLRVSLGMGLALNPTLKVLLIRDASLLDEKSLQLVAEQAAAAGAQVWLEVVGKNGIGIVIEDGEVEAVHLEEESPL